MAKKMLTFFCQNCGYESAKWMGQCPACKAWNSFVEEKVNKKSVNGNGSLTRREEVKPLPMSEINTEEESRTVIGINELDRVLGGGIVKGSLTLVGGDPGRDRSGMRTRDGIRVDNWQGSGGCIVGRGYKGCQVDGIQV